LISVFGKHCKSLNQLKLYRPNPPHNQQVVATILAAPVTEHVATRMLAGVFLTSLFHHR
jgi:hypothetical protein